MGIANSARQGTDKRHWVTGGYFDAFPVSGEGGDEHRSAHSGAPKIRSHQHLHRTFAPKPYNTHPVKPMDSMMEVKVMKTDFYTKTVLTVIACCLVYFVAKDVSPIMHANAQVGGPPAIAKVSEPIEVNIVQVAGKKFSTFDVGDFNAALPVRSVK